MSGRKAVHEYPKAIQDQIAKSLYPQAEAIMANRSVAAELMRVHHVTIPVEPMGKPRQTQSDKWRKRPCVVRYRAYADLLRAHYKGPVDPLNVSWSGYLSMPASWSKTKKAAMAGTPHRARPDLDNLAKGIFDSLWREDSRIASGTMCKFWDDGKGARIELSIS